MFYIKLIEYPMPQIHIESMIEILNSYRQFAGADCITLTLHKCIYTCSI